MKEKLILNFDLEAKDASAENFSNSLHNRLQNIEHQHPYALGITYSLSTSMCSLSNSSLMKALLNGHFKFTEIFCFRSILNLILLIICDKLIGLNLDYFIWKKDFDHIALSLVGAFLAYGWYLSIYHLILSDSVLLNNLSPFFGIMWGFILYNKSPTIKEIIVLLAAIIGLILIARPAFIFSYSNENSLSMIGTFGALLYSCLTALCSYYYKKLDSKTTKANLVLLISIGYIYFSIYLVILQPYDLIVNPNSAKFWVFTILYTTTAVLYNFFNVHASLLIPISKHLLLQYTCILGAILIDIINGDFVYLPLKIFGIFLLVCALISMVIARTTQTLSKKYKFFQHAQFKKKNITQYHLF